METVTALPPVQPVAPVVSPLPVPAQVFVPPTATDLPESMAGMDDLLASVTPEEIENAKKQEQTTTEPVGVEFIALDVAAFLFAAKMFTEKKMSSSDILSRAVMIEFDRAAKTAVFTATDGMMGMSANCKVEKITDAFPAVMFVDIETLYRIAQLRSKRMFVVYEKEDFYVDFFGGRVFVPVYNIKKENFNVRPVEKTAKYSEMQVSPEVIITALHMSEAFLASVAEAELAFMEMRQDGVFLANGVSVLKIIGRFTDLKLRKSDMRMVIAAVQQSVKHDLLVARNEEKIEFQSSVVRLQLPYVDYNFSDQFVQLVSKTPPDYYQVDFALLNIMLSLLDKTHGSSGVVTLTSKSGQLMLESLTRNGKRSFMNLATGGQVPPKDFTFMTQIRGILSVLRVFKLASHVRLGVLGNNLYLFNDDRILAVYGKTS